MNNRKTASKIQLIFTLLIVSLTALWVCSLTVRDLMLPALQWSSGVLDAIVLYVFMYGGYFYFDIGQNDDAIEIKYYNTFPFSREFKMYRIPISAYVKYETEGMKFFKRKLYLFQMSASQLAKYPPIFISAFSSRDDNELSVFFNGLKKSE